MCMSQVEVEKSSFMHKHLSRETFHSRLETCVKWTARPQTCIVSSLQNEWMSTLMDEEMRQECTKKMGGGVGGRGEMMGDFITLHLFDCLLARSMMLIGQYCV